MDLKNIKNSKEIETIERIAGTTLQDYKVSKRFEKYEGVATKEVTLEFPNETVTLIVDKQGVIHRAETEEKVLWTHAKNANVSMIGKALKNVNKKEFSKVTAKQMGDLLNKWQGDKPLVSVGDFLIKDKQGKYLQEGKGTKWTKRLSLAKKYKRLPQAVKVASKLPNAIVYRVEKIEGQV